jgi:glycine/D-amino acid oxidase-like deaminating enzyme
MALTRDHLPHLHKPVPGLLIDIGCMGRGVALQSAMGRAMATYMARAPLALPMPPVEVSRPPFRGLNKLYFQAFVTWYRFLDRCDAHSA